MALKFDKVILIIAPVNILNGILWLFLFGGHLINMRFYDLLKAILIVLVIDQDISAGIIESSCVSIYRWYLRLSPIDPS